ncbi:hypothetical protein SODALDRAFT_20271 [Sodiomyces alkalinus F11]|uniref:Uncharacterized protein n=1 Tax=Sodiomyces alkalinus (strain CBS 110278 / VKM F-3762 / F11) TaxID=1314773 RepID=A0A3N2Q789_SODAK|nr:hypothetical protein SODALDRAFT_20271 [Sodiomyces alkalinus F11]ROT42651.1 hypothetical protein SODALDRAFT_20271 [Sodiomyces alkalinus F11]
MTHELQQLSPNLFPSGIYLVYRFAVVFIELLAFHGDIERLLLRNAAASVVVRRLHTRRSRQPLKVPRPSSCVRTCGLYEPMPTRPCGLPTCLGGVILAGKSTSMASRPRPSR